MTACMFMNSNAPSNITTLWYYLWPNHFDFRHENNSTSGVLIKKIWYLVLKYVSKLKDQNTFDEYLKKANKYVYI